MHEQRSAGIIYVKIDGDQIEARGKFTYQLSGEKKDGGANADGSAYLTGKAELGFIKGSISDTNKVDLEALKDAEDVSVTLELGNGKVISAKRAWQVDAMQGDSETGEIPIEWKSSFVKEIR
jgi:Phage tail tube protein.